MVVASLFLSIPNRLNAQFYNGSTMTFGKSRIQFDDRFWMFYRYKRFETFFYQGGKNLAIYTAQYAEKRLKEMEKEMDYSIDKNIQFVIFNKLSDLKQSNIGLSSDDSYNIGGVAHIVGNKVILYFNGNYKNFEEQISAGIANVILNKMLYGNKMFSVYKNSAMLTFPDWFIKGYVSYLSNSWSTEMDNTVKNGILSGRYKKFNRFEGMDAVYAGHSIWRFIADKYGKSVIPNIIYLTKITKNIESGFLYVLNRSYKEIIDEWLDYYKTEYTAYDADRMQPDSVGLIQKIKRKRLYTRLKICPDSSLFAYVLFNNGKYKVKIQDSASRKRKKILKGGYKIDEKIDYSNPLIGWNPTGEILTIINENKGKLWLYYYTVQSKTLDKFRLFDLDKVLSFSYSQDGHLLALSAIKDGQSDIFVYNRASHSLEQITNDIYDDLDPCFTGHSKNIIFCSDRTSDTLLPDKTVMNVEPASIPKTTDLFLYKYSEKNKVLRRLTNTPLANESSPAEFDNSNITYLSDQNGIRNRYIAYSDSTISFIDTSMHYRYFTSSYPVTDFTNAIIEQDICPQANKKAEIIQSKDKFYMYVRPLGKINTLKPLNLNNTVYMNNLISLANQVKSGTDENTTESLRKAKQAKKQKKSLSNETQQTKTPDNNKPKTQIDINNYSFGTKEIKQNKIKAEKHDTLVKSDTSRLAKQKLFNLPRLEDAEVEYSIDKFVGQLDFSYLNYTYQPFTGSQNQSANSSGSTASPLNSFANSGLNIFLKLGAIDLFEDYRISGGIKISPDLVDNEYIVSFSNLKKRLDKEIVFHRQTIDETNADGLLMRNHMNGIYYILKWPFNPVFSIKGTVSYKNEKHVYLATDINSLQQNNFTINWGGLKGELIFDNTREKGLNLYYGTQFKIFGEYYNQLDNRTQNMTVIGCDFRNYQKIHRTFIFANRFAASTSLGNNKLIYYMGGVDNWVLPAPTFNTEISIAQDQHYAYQTLATNMRGFIQNIRNGNSFAVINSELRFPIFKYFSAKPVNSDFLNNFQIIAFNDIGTAWTGDSPYSETNALFTRTIYATPFKVTIVNQKNPIVDGFGLGVRTRLLGYFMRADYAWGLEDKVINKPIFYFSLGLDF